MRRKKVGLVLGSGAARGLAHIGIVERLSQESIPIDVIAGTSMGAAIGAVYAARGQVSHIATWFSRQSRQKLASYADLALPRTGFIKGDKIKKRLVSFLGGDIDFRALRLPFACVATDLDSGEAVILDRGSVADAVRASISIPGIFTLVEHEGRYLVDGGLVNPVPVDIAQQLGAEFIIAVNVIPDMRDFSAREEHQDERHRHEPNLVQVVMNAVHIGNYSLARASLENADIIIEPQLAAIGAGEFHHSAECIRLGSLAARAALPEIRKKLNL
ncbi:MAG: patatin-like phospholipase family protein [Chloroflexota bacterium]